jgi:hypothetical protein
MTNKNNGTVDEVFLEPLRRAIDEAGTRSCREYADADHVVAGVLRILEKIDSGREWAQVAPEGFGISGLTLSRYFGAVNSARRLALVERVAEAVASEADRGCPAGEDPLAGHEELRRFEAYATDGHSVAASSHEPETLGKVRAPSHIYSLDLRKRSLRHLALCQPQEGKKKEHEMATLKRIDSAALRMGAPKGTKVIHAYDPAIYDFAQWERWKRAKGVYIITVEKANSALYARESREWDRHDPRNNGVEDDQTVGSNGGQVMRRVTYRDPVTLKAYRFLTTEFTLPPGLIAFIYKLRWDIEKAYDHTKNDLGEGKAWSKSESGKVQQSKFITIAYNLCVIFERLLKSDEGIVDEKSLRKARERLAEQMAKAKQNGAAFNSLVSSCVRVTKRSLQFLRWLRHCLRAKRSWSEAIAALRPLMLKYIT